MTSKKVTRQSSCGTLGLPPELACNHCIASINKSLMKGLVSKRIKKCSQPWLPKWAHHRELEKVRVYKKVIKYLGEIDVDSDEVVDVSLYNKEVSSDDENTDTNLQNENTAIVVTLPFNFRDYNSNDGISRESISDSCPDPQSPIRNNIEIDPISNMNREGEERSVRSDTSSKIRYRQVTGSSKKESFIATIPTTHELVTKSRLSALEKKQDYTIPS